jgi:predicted DNA-binding protein (MmcQ/YjbR family)
VDIEKIRKYCLSKKEVTEDSPFGEEHLAFRVCEKIFALFSLDEIPMRVNLKCDPEYAIELREHREQIIPGFHMNKKHWNTVILDNNLPTNFFLELLDHAYEVTAKGLPKKVRDRLLN